MTDKKEVELVPSTEEISVFDYKHPVFIDTYSSLLKIVHKRQIRPANILVAVGMAVQLVQTTKHQKHILANADKKQMVINLLHKLVKDIDATDAERKYLARVFIPKVLDGAIEAMCEMDIQNMTKNICKCLLSCCFKPKVEDEL
jgi:hypothetical protein